MLGAEGGRGEEEEEEEEQEKDLGASSCGVLVVVVLWLLAWDVVDRELLRSRGRSSLLKNDFAIISLKLRYSPKFCFPNSPDLAVLQK